MTVRLLVYCSVTASTNTAHEKSKNHNHVLVTACTFLIVYADDVNSLNYLFLWVDCKTDFPLVSSLVHRGITTQVSLDDFLSQKICNFNY